MTNEQSALVDTDAANKAADADMALQELGADIAGEAYVTATLIVWDEDPRRADEKLRLVEKGGAGPGLHRHGRDGQCRRCLARLAARTRLTPMSASRRSPP